MLKQDRKLTMFQDSEAHQSTSLPASLFGCYGDAWINKKKWIKWKILAWVMASFPHTQAQAQEENRVWV